MSIDTLDFCIDIGNNRKKISLKISIPKETRENCARIMREQFCVSSNFNSSSIIEWRGGENEISARRKKLTQKRRSRNGRQRATRDGEPLWKMKAYLEPISRRNTFPFDGSTIFFQRKQRPLIASFLHIETKKSVDLTKGTAFESIFEKFPTTRENPIGIGRWELRKGRHAEEDGGCKGKENWKGRRRKESEG